MFYILSILKSFQNVTENTCVEVSILIKLQYSIPRFRYICFSLNFVKVSGCSICDLNTIGISKGNVVRHYVDLIIKVFEENFKITQGKWGEVGS